MEIFLFFVELGWLDIVYVNRTGEGSPVETVRKGYLSEGGHYILPYFPHRLSFSPAAHPSPIMCPSVNVLNARQGGWPSARDRGCRAEDVNGFYLKSGWGQGSQHPTP